VDKSGFGNDSTKTEGKKKKSFLGSGVGEKKADMFLKKEEKRKKGNQ